MTFEILRLLDLTNPFGFNSITRVYGFAINGLRLQLQMVTNDDGAIDVSGDTAKVYVVLGELTDDMKADDTASDAQNTDESK